MPKKKLKPVPKFKNEKEEKIFWQTHDSTEYFDLGSGAQVCFPNLKPTTKTISIRLPEFLLARIKTMANFRGIPYQSLIKIFLYEKVNEIKS